MGYKTKKVNVDSYAQYDADKVRKKSDSPT